MLQIEDYLKPEVIKQVRRLDFKASFIVEGFLAGLHSSPFHGFSVEFSDHRKYEPGDDLRYLDWKVWAKTDRYYIKRFQAETNMESYLIMDTSKSMAYSSTGGVTKLEYATYLAASLGYMLIRQQDAVGLALFDQTVRRFIPAKSKRAQLTLIIAELAKVKPLFPTNIAASLNDAALLIKKKGLVVVFTDLLEDPEKVKQALFHFRFKRHEVVLFHILDAAEAHFPFTGQAVFEEPETGQTLTADALALKSRYLERLEAFRNDYAEFCRQNRIDYVPLDTSINFSKALTSFLLARTERSM